MIEIVPVMLFILGWHPDEPGEIDFQRVEVIFTSPEKCEAEGAKIASRMTLAASDKSGATYQHRCMDIPAVEEFEAAYDFDRSPAK